MKTCPYCVELKEKLDAEGIKYQDRDIDNPKFEAEFDKIAEQSDNDSIPVMIIGKQLFLPDVSFKSIDEAVMLAKKFNQA
jgi:glutaredoxin